MQVPKYKGFQTTVLNQATACEWSQMVRCFPKPNDAEKKTQMAEKTMKKETGGTGRH